jgi:cytochrome c oxidase cbb3-type subunit 4
MLEFSHETVVWFSKSWGLFYLLALSAGVLIYTLKPSNKDKFERADNQVLETEAEPCQ